MGISGAAVFNSAVDQAQRSANNLAVIAQQRVKRDREAQIFDISKKKAQLDLDEKAAKGQTTALQNQMLQAQLDEYFKQQKTINDGQTAQIDQAEHQNRGQMETAGKVAKTVFQSDPTVQSMVAGRLNPNLVQTPGPQGGMIQGTPADQSDGPAAIPSSFDNVPDHILTPAAPSMNGRIGGFKEGKRDDFLFKRIDAMKQAGNPLLPQEEQFHNEYTFKQKHPKYSRAAVLNKARQMALDEVHGLRVPLTPDMVRSKVADAQMDLYGETMPGIDNKPAAKGDITPLKTLKEKITLPSNIQTTSQALKYLIEQGMSRQEGIDYLKKNASSQR